MKLPTHEQSRTAERSVEKTTVGGAESLNLVVMCNYNELKRPAKQVATRAAGHLRSSWRSLSSYYRYRESLTYYAEDWLVFQIYSGVYRLNVEPENQR